jgi:hypothetical protein
MESPLPGAGRDDRRREPSEVARRQNRPSPGAARRPLPGRERRLFVASLGTDGSFLSASSTEQTLPAGNVGATRWVAPGVRCTRADVFGDVGPACTTAPGRRTASPLHAVRRAPCVVARNFVGARLHRQIGAVCEPPLQHAMLHRIPRWNRRCQARRGMTDDVDPQRSHDDRIHPHPVLRTGLSLAGRGVSLLLRWKQAAAFCPLAQPSEPLSDEHRSTRAYRL